MSVIPHHSQSSLQDFSVVRVTLMTRWYTGNCQPNIYELVSQSSWFSLIVPSNVYCLQCVGYNFPEHFFFFLMFQSDRGDKTGVHGYYKIIIKSQVISLWWHCAGTESRETWWRSRKNTGISVKHLGLHCSSACVRCDRDSFRDISGPWFPRLWIGATAICITRLLPPFEIMSVNVLPECLARYR